MTNQTKTPGAMVLVERDLMEGWSKRFRDAQIFNCSSQINAVLEARAVLPTAVGTMAARIRAAMIADADQEGVDIAQGRFGTAMAALCQQMDEPPAVGGELERWEFCQNETHVSSEGEWVRYDDHRAHVDQFLVEIDSLTQTSFSQEQVIENLEARIGELEAAGQQGELFAYFCFPHGHPRYGFFHKSTQSGCPAPSPDFSVIKLYAQAQCVPAADDQVVQS